MEVAVGNSTTGFSGFVVEGVATVVLSTFGWVGVVTATVVSVVLVVGFSGLIVTVGSGLLGVVEEVVVLGVVVVTDVLGFIGLTGFVGLEGVVGFSTTTLPASLAIIISLEMEPLPEGILNSRIKDSYPFLSASME